MVAEASWRQELRERMAGRILCDEPAERHTSIGVGGAIDALCFPQNEDELGGLVAFLGARRVPFLAVGNWTNLIVRGGGYRGALISTAALRALTAGDDAEGGVLLEAQAGVPLAEVVDLSLAEAFTGMEFCAGIPGSVGGAVRMNAGAYGGEIKDVCRSVRLLDRQGRRRTVGRAELAFSYRNLDLPAETIIIGATFRLRRGEAEAIGGRIREIIAQRSKKHPLEFRNAGSIFKNPPELPAGRLIEAAGLRGMRRGDAQVSEKHGNFIVNRGRATAEDLLGLIDTVAQRVYEATGYTLEREVKIIGEGTAAGADGER